MERLSPARPTQALLFAVQGRTIAPYLRSYSRPRYDRKFDMDMDSEPPGSGFRQ